MNVIIIKEECHGLIGIADSIIHAIDFLINENWLNEYTDIFQYAGNDKWTEISIKKRFGVDWEKTIKQFNLEELNDVFDGCFYFSEETVYKGED